MNAALPAPLSDAEIDDLATRLTAIRNPDSLSLEGVDGLFCALIASPDLVSPSEYLPVILGGEPGESHIHLPYVEEPGVDGILGRAWARGFMRGTRLAPVGWTELFTDENEGQVVTIPLVAGEVDPDWPKEPLSSEQSDELLQSMIVGAARAYERLAELRRDFAEEFSDDVDDDEFYPETYVRSEPKVGRNDPCPCGSGKKYKKCCGSAA
jgi:uncharacterized protein